MGDYSNLINPRVKSPNIAITAPDGRTLLEAEDLDEDSKNFENTTEIEIENMDDNVEDVETSEKIDESRENDDEISRRRRDNAAQSEETPKLDKRRLENVFVPEDGDDIMPRDGAGSDVSDKEKKKLREEKRSQRKKE